MAEYSLMMHLSDVHTAHDTHCYPNRPGNNTAFCVYRLTAAEILALGNAITIEAYKAKAQQERNNVQGGEPCQKPC